FGLLGALGAGAILALGLEGVGVRLRRSVHLPFLGMADGVLGALLSATVALAIAWLVGVVVVALPAGGSLENAVRGSRILRQLDELLPPSGVVLNALTRIDPLPALALNGSSVSPPPGGFSTAAVARAERGVVRVVGTACGLGIEGSGWVAAPDLVVTNAHVVAGEDDTMVERSGEPTRLHATVVRFDARNDIAVLRVPGLDRRALRLVRAPRAQTPGAILGYPLDGPFVADPARIGVTEDVETSNAYGRGSLSRRLTAVRGLIRPGNSGGPVVTRSGAVLTTVFAATTSSGPQGGYGVANDTVATDLAGLGGPVSTDGCTS
ncbi:MAG TPA: trypsin-like peptidase domain-containing protein, partial [Solirubrobacteraceae bacterium]|nr:trypsin-like peptidase domain-containing protein [Solirubrobacteraceae bacterium]